MLDQRRDLKNQIKSHFSQMGVKFDVKAEALDRQFEQALGPNRYEEWEELKWTAPIAERYQLLA